MSINKPAIGIHIIQRDKPGSFARILANLSGIQFKQPDYAQNYKIPSFHYSRYQNCIFGKKQDENYFYYTADITLEEQEKVIKDGEEAIGAVVLSLPSPDPSSRERNKIIEAMNKLLFNSDRDKFRRVKIKIIDDERFIYLDQNTVNNEEFVYELLTKECIFQVTTSPEAYRAKLFNLLKNWNFYKGFANVEAEIGRAYIDTTFQYSYREEIPKGSPLAKLYLCCSYGNKPGALAAAINTLLFKKFECFQNNNKKRIFNIMFYIDYFSFASGVAYDAIYGNLENCNKRINEGQLKKNVIERILICPITGDQSWRGYAKNLVNFLNNKECKINSKNVENKYIMKPGNTINDQNIPNILIYRDNKSPCKICEIGKDGEPELRPNKGCDICRKYWWPPTGLNPQFRSGSM